jgi:alpha-tubulin suppressor-like RCC1 family protein
MWRPSLQQLSIAALGLGTLALVQACGAHGDSTGPSLGPGFSVTVGASAVTLVPGGAAGTFITATRARGLSSPITYTVSGAPAGLTATVVPTPVADSVTVTFAAAATLAPALYPVAFTASATGAPDQQATITVNVMSPPADTGEVATVVTGAHSCAITTAGAAYCWGYNGSGQLGNGDTSLVTPKPVAVAGGLTFRSLSVSKVEDVTCGITVAGAAYCWGTNASGQLGDGTMTRRLVPTPVAGGLTFTSLAVGNGHVCGIVTGGSVTCWGTSPNGAFGDGSVGLRLTPAASAPGLTLTTIVTGNDYTCGLTAAGAVYCWGLGVFGQLGNGGISSSLTPVAVSGGLTFRTIAAGGFAVCGLTMDDRAFCWGHDFYGTLGNGTSATEGGLTRSPVPIAVEGGLRFASLSAGFETMCGVTASGAGYCWGYNESGQVGDGSNTHRSTPTAVAGGLTFRSISAGTGSSCGLTTTGATYCWGDNANGSLGDGTTTSSLTPVAVRWR